MISLKISKTQIFKSASKLATATNLNSGKKQLMTTHKPNILLYSSSHINTSQACLYWRKEQWHKRLKTIGGALSPKKKSGSHLNSSQFRKFCNFKLRRKEVIPNTHIVDRLAAIISHSLLTINKVSSWRINSLCLTNLNLMKAYTRNIWCWTWPQDRSMTIQGSKRTFKYRKTL